MDMIIHTIGHSTRSAEEFAGLLEEHHIRLLADIRRYPGSRRYPHFSSEALAATLDAAGIAYRHVPELGGRRKPAADSLNGGWHNDQFRAYADSMATPAFAAAVSELVAVREAMVIMCAEAVPWRCHRNLVADELVRRGIEVRHILAPGSVRRHEMNPMARLIDGHLVYPAPQLDLLD